MTQTSRITGTASKTTRETHNPADEPWPANVTARILTRYGNRFSDLRATVDIHDDGHISRAICGPCNREVAKKPQIYRDKTLDEAAEHANECMAMPRPATNTAIHHSA